MIRKAIPIQLRPSSNLFCVIGNLQHESTEEFVRFTNTFLWPYLSSSYLTEEYLRKLKQALRGNVEVKKQIDLTKKFNQPIHTDRSRLDQGLVASGFRYNKTSDAESDLAFRLRSKFSAINSDAFRAAGKDLSIIDEICFWFIVQPQLLHGAQVLKHVSNFDSTTLKARHAFEFLVNKCIIPVDHGNQRAIMDDFNFPFQINERNPADNDKKAPEVPAEKAKTMRYRFLGEMGTFEKVE